MFSFATSGVPAPRKPLALSGDDLGAAAGGATGVQWAEWMPSTRVSPSQDRTAWPQMSVVSKVGTLL